VKRLDICMFSYLLHVLLVYTVPWMISIP